MQAAKECSAKAREFAQRARLASTREKQFILYGMGWMWMNLAKHAELREGALSAETADQDERQRQSAQD